MMGLAIAAGHFVVNRARAACVIGNVSGEQTPTRAKAQVCQLQTQEIHATPKQERYLAKPQRTPRKPWTGFLSKRKSKPFFNAREKVASPVPRPCRKNA